MKEIFTLLNPNNTVTINRPLAHAIGLNEAIIFAALLAKCHYYTENDMLYEGKWFYSTTNDLFESTALSEKQQRLCVDNLVKEGLIECKRMGMPAKRYFHVVDDAELLEKYIGQGEEQLAKLKPCSYLSAEQETPKGRNKNLPKVGTCSDERAEHIYIKLKIKKPKRINPKKINLSIPRLRRFRDLGHHSHNFAHKRTALIDGTYCVGDKQRCAVRGFGGLGREISHLIRYHRKAFVYLHFITFPAKYQ